MMGKKAIVFVTLIVMLATGIVLGLRFFVKNRVEEELSARVAQSSAVERLDYETFESGFLGSWFSLKNVSLKIAGIDQPVRMREVRIPEYRLEDEYLSELHLEIDELVVPSVLYVPGIVENRQAMGDLKADASLFYRYDPSSGTLSLENLEIVSPSLGDAVLNINLTNIDPTRISLDDPVSSVPTLMGVSIASADLSYRDRSALKKLLRTGDNQPTPLQQSMSRFISEEIARLERTEGSKRALAALRNLRIFLRNPEKIHIAASPEKPVPLGRFIWVRHPGDFFDIMNIRIDM